MFDFDGVVNVFDALPMPDVEFELVDRAVGMAAAEDGLAEVPAGASDIVRVAGVLTDPGPPSTSDDAIWKTSGLAPQP